MERRPDPEPLESNEIAPFLVVMAAWLVGLAVLGIDHTSISRHHESWWYWVCGVGFGFGFYGLWFVRRRARSKGRSGS